MTTKKFLIASTIIVTLAACNSHNGKNSLVTLIDEPAGANCQEGGKRVEVGVDKNSNGGLDANEVTQTSYICNGAIGPAGQNGASCSITDNQDGSKTIGCAAGATITVSAGAQGGDACSVADNQDSTVTINCGGTAVTVAYGTGANGHASLVNITPVLAGTPCSAGGQMVQSGLDQNDDGTLQTGEVVATQYVCNGVNGTNGTDGTDGSNGTNGYNSLLLISNEPAGSNCPSGGKIIQSGLDINDNGTLESGEVTSTQYVCDDAGTSSIYGNGSDGEANFSGIVDWVTNPPSGTLQFTNLSITGTLTVPSGLILRATGIVTISGSIKVSNNVDASLGIAATAAAVGDRAPGGFGMNAALAHMLVNPGSRGGSVGGTFDGMPGYGGGTIVIIASGALNVSGGGSIVATGGDGTTNDLLIGAGGGGGGIIVLASQTSIANSGTLSAKGGAGGAAAAATSPSGGGGGGIVNLFAPSISAGTIDVSGGAAGSGTSISGSGGGGGGSGGSGGSAGGTTPATPATSGLTGLSFPNIVVDPSALFVFATHL